jgi:hypothetical protein
MLSVMFGIVLLIVVIAVSAAAIDDARLVEAASNSKLERSRFDGRSH